MVELNLIQCECVNVSMMIKRWFCLLQKLKQFFTWISQISIYSKMLRVVPTLLPHPHFSFPVIFPPHFRFITIDSFLISHPHFSFTYIVNCGSGFVNILDSPWILTADHFQDWDSVSHRTCWDNENSAENMNGNRIVKRKIEKCEVKAALLPKQR